MLVRCPQCHSPIDLADDTPLSDSGLADCGQFQLGPDKGGSTADARQTLEQAGGLIDAHLPKLATGELGTWQGWLINQILR